VPSHYNASFDSAFVVWTNEQNTLDLFQDRLRASGFSTWWYGPADATTKTKGFPSESLDGGRRATAATCGGDRGARGDQVSFLDQD